MPGVYDDDNFAGRVATAAATIARRGEPTRAFDTCFEMCDGEFVALVLARRAAARPEGRLACNIGRYLNADNLATLLVKHAALHRRDIPAAAARMRAQRRADFAAFMAARDA